MTARPYSRGPASCAFRLPDWFRHLFLSTSRFSTVDPRIVMRFVIVKNLKVFFLEVPHCAALLIPDHDGHQHSVDVYNDPGRYLLISVVCCGVDCALRRSNASCTTGVLTRNGSVKAARNRLFFPGLRSPSAGRRLLDFLRLLCDRLRPRGAVGCHNSRATRNGSVNIGLESPLLPSAPKSRLKGFLDS